MIQFRDYQAAAIAAITPALMEGKSTLVSAAVGAGKTIIQAGFFQQFMQEVPTARMLSLAHTQELILQNSAAMVDLWPGAPIGINSAALGRRDFAHPILFASIQSVAKHAARIGFIDVAFVDEAHLIPSNMSSQYQTFLKTLEEINPDLRIVGLSGTPFRLDSGWLHKGRKKMFDSLCYEISIPDLIERGFLVPPISRKMDAEFNIAGVHTRAGDYIASELQDAVNVDDVTRAAVKEMVDIGRAQGRKSWLCFCAGVEHAYAVAEEIRRHGITCEAMEGNLEATRRADVLARFKRGEIQCLTNVNVLSIGFNHPAIDLLALMRPTKSAGLYIQQVGRGLRCLGRDYDESLARGKSDCLVLDFAGVVKSLGPVDAPLVTESKEGGGDRVVMTAPPMKECFSCQSYVPAASRECPYCDSVFNADPGAPKIEATASTLPILSEHITPKAPDSQRWVNVDEIGYYAHVKRYDPASPPTLRVAYQCGIRSFNEYLCFEHEEGSRARRAAAAWWRERGGDHPIPETVAEALERAEEVTPVKAVRVVKDGKFDKVISRRDEPVEKEPSPTAHLDLKGTIGERKAELALIDDDIPF